MESSAGRRSMMVRCACQPPNCGCLTGDVVHEAWETPEPIQGGSFLLRRSESGAPAASQGGIKYASFWLRATVPDDPETLKARLIAKQCQGKRLRYMVKELQRHRFSRRAETLPENHMLLTLKNVEQAAA